eukprot:m.124537 g.124537  ORF g.124537 m.124537 type:complete len:345 (-) comp16295_c0_seq3:29-1063(-)
MWAIRARRRAGEAGLRMCSAATPAAACEPRKSATRPSATPLSFSVSRVQWCLTIMSAVSTTLSAVSPREAKRGGRTRALGKRPGWPRRLRMASLTSIICSREEMPNTEPSGLTKVLTTLHERPPGAFGWAGAVLAAAAAALASAVAAASVICFAPDARRRKSRRSRVNAAANSASSTPIAAGLSPAPAGSRSWPSQGMANIIKASLILLLPWKQERAARRRRRARSGRAAASVRGRAISRYMRLKGLTPPSTAGSANCSSSASTGSFSAGRDLSTVLMWERTAMPAALLAVTPIFSSRPGSRRASASSNFSSVSHRLSRSCTLSSSSVSSAMAEKVWLSARDWR